MPAGNVQFVDNPEPRCPVVLLLDISGSMADKPIQELNDGIVDFKDSVSSDRIASLRVDVAIITFGSDVELVQDFVTIDQFEPPVLKANGLTYMGKAINTALDLLDKRKEDYRDNGIQYYRPWVVLITDGAPSDPWQNAAQQVKDGENSKKFSFFTVGVKGADMNILSQIAPQNRPPLMLTGLNFKELFLWLSASMSMVAASQPGDMVQAPSAGTWADIEV